jgi:hypothetical protein
LEAAARRVGLHVRRISSEWSSNQKLDIRPRRLITAAASRPRHASVLLSARALEKMHGLSGQDRDDAAAFAYADQVARSGNFDYVCATLVLNPQRDQTYYHLIYGTRHPKGIEVFKQAERSASEFMALARADAQQRQRIESTRQTEMFSVLDYGAEHDHHLLCLRNRYLQQAHDLVKKQLTVNRHRPTPYEDAWKMACRFPLVWESDLHTWINQE